MFDVAIIRHIQEGARFAPSFLFAVAVLSRLCVAAHNLRSFESSFLEVGFHPLGKGLDA